MGGAAGKRARSESWEGSFVQDLLTGAVQMYGKAMLGYYTAFRILVAQHERRHRDNVITVSTGSMECVDGFLTTGGVQDLISNSNVDQQAESTRKHAVVVGNVYGKLAINCIEAGGGVLEARRLLRIAYAGVVMAADVSHAALPPRSPRAALERPVG